MTTPVFALIIGVSNYHSKRFEPLPAASSDALHLFQLLREQGILEKNIFLLNDPIVTLEKYEKCIEQIASLKTPFELLFYFCGHGYRTTGLNPESYLILSNTEIEQISCTKGLSLERVLQTFYQMHTTALYIFIDACRLRVNSLINPKWVEEIQGNKDSKKTLFCLLSSGIHPSYENVKDKYGYFTEALIKAIRELSHSNCSPEALYTRIQKELQKNTLPQPEMYNIGTYRINLFPYKKLKEDFNATLGAIYSCGIVMNESLFCRVFNIKEEVFKELESLGLIFFEKGAWHPHRSLIAVVEKECISLAPALAKLYWYEQFYDLPDRFETALHFVMTIQIFDYETKYDEALFLAFKILFHHKPRAIDALKNSVSIYPQGTQSKSKQYLAEILIELREFDLTKSLMNIEVDQKNQSYCHLLWRTGSFSDCILETTKLINIQPTLQVQIPYYWHRGTAQYLMGNWNHALSDFSFIKRSSNNVLYTGRSLCLLGTLTGLRGIFIEESKAQIENGIAILMKNGDLSGAWVGWNNLGEILCKAGDLGLSKHYLKKALDIAQELECQSMILETLRNFVQLELRSHNCSKSLLLTLLEQIERILSKPIEFFETLQIYNTLCTAHLFLNQLHLAQHYLNQAIPVTISSKEYHIYTLANLASICKRHKLKDKSNHYFQRALDLANEGNNLFAIQQIQKQDHSLSYCDNC